MIWGGGGGTRTGDYHTPLGPVLNSQTRVEQGSLGVGYFAGRRYGSLTYDLYDGKYGVPTPPPGSEVTEDPVQLKFRRQLAHFNGGINAPNTWLERINLGLSYSDWRHFEMEEAVVANRYYNKQFKLARGSRPAQARHRDRGSFGAMGYRRDYKAIGPEATSPPVIQNALAAFGLEQFDFKRFRLQFGGRVENTRYNPAGLERRAFTGFSGAAGFQAPLWEGGSFAANYSHSYRAPALEELYALGPHAGNLTYEIGNLHLLREAANGVDVSLRHHGSRVRGDVSVFQYRIADYVFSFADRSHPRRPHRSAVCAKRRAIPGAWKAPSIINSIAISG